jgi:aspartate aminotransferase
VTDPANVIVTAGGKQAIFEALAATLSEGDEVIVPAPWWVSYPQMVRFCRRARGAAGDACERRLPLRSRRSRIADHPAHATGCCSTARATRPARSFPRSCCAASAEVLRRHPQVLVLSDDIYAPLNYTGRPHATLAALCPDLADRICTVSGVSKSHAMTGFASASPPDRSG